jgi:UDP-GlcNAc:undecaprenyl-phosphate/decaprenyl-phosphate GlcNAc-1-phosphate transferase
LFLTVFPRFGGLALTAVHGQPYEPAAEPTLNVESSVMSGHGESLIPLLAGVAFAWVASGLTIAGLLRARLKLPQDAPNERSLHRAPLPRGGGIALWVGWLPVALWAPPVAGGETVMWLIPWLALALVSLRDDVRALGVGVRLTVHAAAALWFAIALAWTAAAGGPDPTWLPMMLVALPVAAIVAWSLNLYNFMDGNDGLAAAMAILGFSAYGAGAMIVGAPATAFFALAAATLPFLWVNFPPSRLIMGDVGSVPLGFLAGAFGVSLVAMGKWPAWFPALVFLPFIADATTTLARRIWHRERIWEAHRDHYYQRLHQLGARHRGTLAVYSLWMAACGLTAVACLKWDKGLGWPAFCAWSFVSAAFFAAIDYHWRSRPDSIQ